MHKWILKLVIGVVGGVVAGVVVWAITQGPFALDEGPPSVDLSPRIPESIAASEVFPVSFSAANEHDTTETGCGGYVSLQRIDLEDPALRSGDTGRQSGDRALPESVPEFVAPERGTAIPETATLETEAHEPDRPELDLSDRSLARALELTERPDLTEVPRITRQPELIERPEFAAPAERPAAFAKCNTEDREFELDPVGSMVSIASRCVVSRAGDYRMTYGVRCDDRSNGEWAIEGEAEFTVEEP